MTMAVYGTPSEQQFISLLKENDQRAFSQVFKQYYTALCYFANKFVFNKQEAEDIVAGVFEKLWKGEIQITSINHLRSFLYITTKRSCIDALRKNGHAQERQLNFANQIGDQEPECIQQIIRAEVLQQINQEIKALPEQCSKIITLSYINGLKNDEIASKLGLSVQTVKNQKSRGLSLLRGKLSPQLFQIFLLAFLK
ncbi:RNA polymerase sigma factor [Pedobacter sp. UBA4863]|uniref:RNA polymerase sigma factor n=1 Tax=Pedobacter sp. UBA4863 TaxID=1947060 RepID=UPI0025F038D8|nr:RNA polymerase sigma-70 factor [Pedobacter sp. UBA4863]